MITKVKKWGNSLAIRLPREVVEGLGTAENGEVSLEKNGNSFSLKRVEKKNKLTLESLCDQINQNNLNEEIDWGKPVGKEIW